MLFRHPGTMKASLIGTLVCSLAACGGDNAGPLSIGNIDVGGYSLYYVCGGKGTPTVIIEAGAGDSTDHSWAKVFPEIRPDTKICRYSRAGLGLSDEAPIPRTSQDMVADLHALLNNANIEPPYVLVGHSIGGFNVRLYSATYPDEVVGMVLVDASHPDYWTRLRNAIPPEDSDESLALSEMRNVLFDDGDDHPEGIDVDASADEVRNTGPMGDIPLVVITRAFGAEVASDLPPEFVRAAEQAWQELQVDLTTLSTNSTHVVAAKAGHFVQVDEPQLVIDAIRKVVEEVRKKGR